MPFFAKTAQTNPEQSTPSYDVPPHEYGTPKNRIAVAVIRASKERARCACSIAATVVRPNIGNDPTCVAAQSAWRPANGETAATREDLAARLRWCAVRDAVLL